MRYTGPKVRLSRKLGIALTPKAGRIMEKKPYPPGEHGQSRRRSSRSDYKLQLLEKQRLRFQYDLSEKQLRNYFAKAKRMQGNAADNLIYLLETRLLTTVYRGGLARSIYAARQYITHGHILVNGKRINLPSYHIRPEDVITVKDKSKKLDCFGEAVKYANVPPYLDLNKPKLTVTVLSNPETEDVPIICQLSDVIEYYSR